MHQIWGYWRSGTVLAVFGLLFSIATPARAELKVVVTIKPVHALVAGVMQGIATPELLVTGSASPHTFAMRPSGARALNAADVFFRVSPWVEPFTARLESSLPSSVRMVTLANSPGIEKLAIRRGDTFEPHDHDHQHDHSGDHEIEESAKDGHVWLDPDNAQRMVAEIARVLSEIAPEEALRLQENAARVTAAIEALDKEIAAELLPVSVRPYVVFHDAYQYFERRYGLSPVGAITIGPDVQPGARRLSEIRRKIAGLGAVCVFAEPQYQHNVIGAITEGSNTRAATLDPEGALISPGPEAYTSLMRNLANGLKSCLEQS